MRRTHALLALLLAAGACAPVSSAAAKAELDGTFGSGGVRVLSTLGDHASALTVAGSRVYVADDGDQVAAASGATGNVLGSFGAAGTAAVGLANDHDAPATLVPDPRAGDPHGLLVVGARGLGYIVVARLTGRGEPDAAYGRRGVTEAIGGNGFVFPARNALAAGDGAVTVAGYLSGGFCPGGKTCEPRIAVARLTPDGRPDPSWGVGGTVTIPVGTSFSGQVALGRRPGGGVTVITVTQPGGSQTQVLAVPLDATGQLAAAPSRTLEVLPAFSVLDVLPDGDGGFVLTRGESGGTTAQVTRLDGDGVLDPRYVDARVPSGLNVLGARTTPDGLVLVGRSVVVRSGGHTSSVVARLRPGGRVDGGFGTHGTLEPRFPGSRLAQEIRSVDVDALGRLVLGGSVGDLFTGIREDFGETHLGLMRLRTRPPDATLASSVASVTRGGVASVRVRCGARVPGGCGRGTLRVRRGGRTVGRATLPALRAGVRRVVRVRLGATGRRLAVPRAQVDVILAPHVRSSRAQETAPVLRHARLRRAA